MRTTEDIAKELFDRKTEGGYIRAMIVASYDRDDLLYHDFIKAEDGFDAVLHRLNQCIQDGGEPIGMVFTTRLDGIDDQTVGLESYVYPEYAQFEWAHKEIAYVIKFIQGKAPGFVQKRLE